MTTRVRVRGRGVTGAWALAPVLTRGEDFVMGSARGYVTYYLPPPGRLPAQWERLMKKRADRMTYVVMSYSTPIAWHDSEVGWIVPSVSYSVTTARHQSIVRQALRIAGLDYYAQVWA